MRRRAALALPALLLLIPARAQAAAWELVTADEAAASARAGLPPVARSLAAGPGPRIEVVTPSETAPLRPPLTIRLRFAPAPGAMVDPTSFRALYGAFRVDVTDRLRAHARIDAAGLVAEEVALPAGQHRIILSVADDQGRRGERDFRLRID
ncbi:hypothetical protein [Neoroseomonas oryzicola]|uniref:Copper resistance protein CopC n=1 Tax=Neoroseomonas oryzicola TaxID=535904 RepID=A0A9X9WGG4_9PROT|nr:hypothetical protein [Neoroseomonas oryzicola]MBR0659424.1 hypothetical protein [Neoroseomonas oryzicola]NKE16429.1 hypothetical protein [Neoroseomonas oryzicola]